MLSQIMRYPIFIIWNKQIRLSCCWGVSIFNPNFNWLRIWSDMGAAWDLSLSCISWTLSVNWISRRAFWMLSVVVGKDNTLKTWKSFVDRTFLTNWQILALSTPKRQKCHYLSLWQNDINVGFNTYLVFIWKKVYKHVGKFQN